MTELTESLVNGESSEATVLVADLGATFVRVARARCGRLGPVTRRRIADLPQQPDTGIVEAIIDMLREAAEGAKPGHLSFGDRQGTPAAAGIGVAATVDLSGGLHEPLPFPVPEGFFLRDRVATALEVPVALDNDANMAALGELTYGAGRNRRDFLVLTLGTNLGMGIVAGGELYRGAHGRAAEIGLLLVPAQPAAGTTGNDGGLAVTSERFGDAFSNAPEGYAWIEEFVGGRALSEALAALRSSEGERTGGSSPGTAPAVLREAKAGDPAARRILQLGIEGWAYALGNAVTLLDPEAVVIAGGLSEDLEPFLGALRQRVGVISRASPEVLITQLGTTGGLRGAEVAARRLLQTTMKERPTGEALSAESGRQTWIGRMAHCHRAQVGRRTT